MPPTPDPTRIIDRDLRAHDADLKRLKSELEALRCRVYDDLMDSRRRTAALETQLADIDRHLHLVPAGRD